MPFILMAFLTACSSNAKIHISQNKTSPIPPGKTVSLLVEPDVPEVKPIHEDVASRLRERLFGKLVSERIFKAVLHSPDPADFRMDVKLHGARQVSTGARIWLGAMAGSNNLTLTTQVYDSATGSLLTAFDIEAASASHPLSSEAELDDAVREAVDKIISILR